MVLDRCQMVLGKRDAENAILNTYSKIASANFLACNAAIGVTLLW